MREGSTLSKKLLKNVRREILLLLLYWTMTTDSQVPPLTTIPPLCDTDMQTPWWFRTYPMDQQCSSELRALYLAKAFTYVTSSPFFFWSLFLTLAGTRQSDRPSAWSHPQQFWHSVRYKKSFAHFLFPWSNNEGHTTARMLASLLPQSPEFRGRRVVTFHNQRDFIFVRHHRSYPLSPPPLRLSPPLSSLPLSLSLPPIPPSLSP